jgi:hypothetical protein
MADNSPVSADGIHNAGHSSQAVKGEHAMLRGLIQEKLNFQT